MPVSEACLLFWSGDGFSEIFSVEISSISSPAKEKLKADIFFGVFGRVVRYG